MGEGEIACLCVWVSVCEVCCIYSIVVAIQRSIWLVLVGPTDINVPFSFCFLFFSLFPHSLSISLCPRFSYVWSRGVRMWIHQKLCTVCAIPLPSSANRSSPSFVTLFTWIANPFRYAKFKTSPAVFSPETWGYGLHRKKWERKINLHLMEDLELIIFENL